MQICLPIVLAIVVLFAPSSSLPLTVYYDGSLSLIDDIHLNSSLIMIKKSLSINGAGGFEIEPTLKCSLAMKWARMGMKVGLVIDTSLPNFQQIFSTEENTNRSIETLRQILFGLPVMGIQLYISSFNISPFKIGQYIKQLKLHLGGNFVSVSMRPWGIHHGSSLYKQTDISWGQANYLIPILNQAGLLIDRLVIRADSGWYDNLELESIQFLKDVTMQWHNLRSDSCKMLSRNCSVFSSSQLLFTPRGIIAIGFEDELQSENCMDPSVLLDFIVWSATYPHFTIASMYAGTSYTQSLTLYKLSNIILEERIKFYGEKIYKACVI